MLKDALQGILALDAFFFKSTWTINFLFLDIQNLIAFYKTAFIVIFFIVHTSLLKQAFYFFPPLKQKHIKYYSISIKTNHV